jgi:hypothetical protein
MEADINYWAVLVAAVSSFVIGGLWYAPFLFGNAWQKAVGLSDEELKNANMGKTFGLSFVLSVLISYGMAMFFGGEVDFHLGINSLFEHHSLKLFLINAGYNLLIYTVIGGIIGAW